MTTNSSNGQEKDWKHTKGKYHLLLAQCKSLLHVNCPSDQIVKQRRQSLCYGRTYCSCRVAVRLRTSAIMLSQSVGLVSSPLIAKSTSALSMGQRRLARSPSHVPRCLVLVGVCRLSLIFRCKPSLSVQIFRSTFSLFYFLDLSN